MSDSTPQHTAGGDGGPDAGGDGGPGTGEDRTGIYVDHRELLFSIVYSMLGSVADTEDVLQETWLAWAAGATGGEPVRSPKAYLVRIAVNKALGRQAAISRRRETYLGPWLPEPVATPEQGGADATAERIESVSIALLVVLETLTPLERAVFVLHEVFGYPHTDTARILDRSPAAVRQLAHRAREHVRARRPRYRTDPVLRRQVTERFVAAVSGGDLPALLRLLAPDVTMWADGGGKATAAGPRPVHGREKVARLLAAAPGRAPGGLDIHYRQLNGGPSVVLADGDHPFGVLAVELTPDGEQVLGVYFVTNPDKLAHLGRPGRTDRNRSSR
ncbi:sigma-70 family RNA polymerase sigma factor [Kitasatospora sp. NPDC094015]|uniref:sigma-70 family RNA polymerase sigma factor n=1 Tax=Kitasatospora sp. NPDC094015 TaxID=3155205 RepID=UPI003328F534